MLLLLFVWLITGEQLHLRGQNDLASLHSQHVAVQHALTPEIIDADASAAAERILQTLSSSSPTSDSSGNDLSSLIYSSQQAGYSRPIMQPGYDEVDRLASSIIGQIKTNNKNGWKVPIIEKHEVPVDKLESEIELNIKEDTKLDDEAVKTIERVSDTTEHLSNEITKSSPPSDTEDDISKSEIESETSDSPSDGVDRLAQRIVSRIKDESLGLSSSSATDHSTDPVDRLAQHIIHQIRPYTEKEKKMLQFHQQSADPVDALAHKIISGLRDDNNEKAQQPPKMDSIDELATKITKDIKPVATE